MAILIPDNCSRVASQGVQRVFGLLRDGLPDDFTAWYEPACGETGRDFTLLSPNFGLVLLAVRGWYPKHLAVVSETELLLQTGEGEQVAETTETHPLHLLRGQVAELCQRLVQEPLLRDADVPDRPRLPVGCGVVLANITRAQLTERGLGEGFSPGVVLCRDELEALILARSDRETVRAFRAMLLDDRSFTPLSAEEVSTLRGLLHPDTVVRQHPAMPAPGSDTRPPAGALALETFDQHQEQVARTLGEGHRIFAGVAGSGKTILLLHRARMLAGPDKRVLVLCFNRVLGNRLAGQLRETAPTVEVFSFHAWARELTRLPTSVGEPFEVYERRLVTTLARTLELLPTASRYDAILIDEAHDFEPEWFRLVVSALKDRENGSLFLAVDGAQSLYGRARTFTWKSVGIHAQGRTQRLTVNYRNTREILQLAWDLTQADLPEDEENDSPIIRLRPEQCLRTGPPPAVWPCRGFRDEHETLRHLIARYREQGIPPEEIAVLYARQEGSRIPDLVAALEQVGDVCWINDPGARGNRDHFNRLPGVRVLTIHSAKGLEFPVVLLCALDQLPDTAHPDAGRDANLLYVGLTRAITHLAVTWVGTSRYTQRARELVPVGSR
jgi:hypothetical protein